MIYEVFEVYMAKNDSKIELFIKKESNEYQSEHGDIFW